MKRKRLLKKIPIQRFMLCVFSSLSFLLFQILSEAISILKDALALSGIRVRQGVVVGVARVILSRLPE